MVIVCSTVPSSPLPSPQVLEHRTADSRHSAIGLDLLRSPDIQLYLSSADDSPFLQQLQALLRRCGSFDRQDRPVMEEVAGVVDELMRKAEVASPPAVHAASLPVVTDDRAELMTLLEVLGGLRARMESSWSSDTELSSWNGVAVGSDGRVILLELEDCGLNGEKALWSF